MSLTDHNGFPIFTCPASQESPLLTCRDEAPPASVPALVRAASSQEGARPWRVRYIDSERSEIVDAEGTPLRVVGEREPLEYIAAIVNESGR